MQEEQVDLAPGGERAQHLEVAGGHPREAEERETIRKLEQLGFIGQTRTRGLSYVQICPSPGRICSSVASSWAMSNSDCLPAGAITTSRKRTGTPSTVSRRSPPLLVSGG